MQDFEGLVNDYTGSQQFLVLESPVKARAAELLGSFAAGCRLKNIAPETFTIAGLDDVLNGTMARLDAPPGDRKQVPALLETFFSWLAESGCYPPAKEWAGWVPSLAGKYLERFRDDGSVRGETYKKRYTDVGRNDPCPCGSGKKFKKCCRGLIS